MYNSALEEEKSLRQNEFDADFLLLKEPYCLLNLINQLFSLRPRKDVSKRRHSYIIRSLGSKECLMRRHNHIVKT